MYYLIAPVGQESRQDEGSGLGSLTRLLSSCHLGTHQGRVDLLTPRVGLLVGLRSSPAVDWIPHPYGLLYHFLNVLMTWQLASLRASGSERFQNGSCILLLRRSGATYHYFCYSLLITQMSAGTMWKEMTQGCE